MASRGLLILVTAAAFGACSGDATTLDAHTGDATAREPERSEIRFRAVDAGSGDDIVDGDMTVRYLVRSPMTLDASAVERVSTAEPYRIEQSVASDSLVVEVRLEAASYGRLDTVLSVARGASVGPIRIPMALRGDRLASLTRDRGQPARGAEGGPGGGTARTDAGDGGAAGTGMDRGPMRQGDRAFEAADWSGAAAAYRRMPRPEDRQGDYAREYGLALVRRGIAHISLGEWQDAHQALMEAVSYDFREYSAYFYLGQVQCTLGQYDAGRASLREVERFTPMISAGQRTVVGALVEYQLGVCSHEQFQRARVQSEMQRAGQLALTHLQAFVDRAGASSPTPAEFQAALPDARRRLEHLQSRIR